MQNTLTKICADKKVHVEKNKQQISESELVSMASSASPVRGFANALQRSSQENKTALIAEVKKASPSKGIIREDFNPSQLAREYQEGGATCISVLTDQPYFQGRDEYLTEVREEVDLPVLRKDFIIDTYQIPESRAYGADCILLIMAALEDSQAQEIEDAALEFHMDVLVEIHNAEELERALKLESPLLGINNRNLKTLEVDIATTEILAPLVPAEKLVICESGIFVHDDIKRMNSIGVNSFLVGESLMRESDVAAATRKLLTSSL